MFSDADRVPAFLIECHNTTGSAQPPGIQLRFDGELVPVGGVIGGGGGVPALMPAGASWREIVALHRGRHVGAQSEPGRRARTARAVPMTPGRHRVAFHCGGAWSNDVSFFWDDAPARAADHRVATTITVTAGGRTKSVFGAPTKSVFDFFGAPDELRVLEQRIDELAGITQYTGRPGAALERRRQQPGGDRDPVSAGAASVSVGLRARSRKDTCRSRKRTRSHASRSASSRSTRAGGSSSAWALTWRWCWWSATPALSSARGPATRAPSSRPRRWPPPGSGCSNRFDGRGRPGARSSACGCGSWSSDIVRSTDQ